MRIFILLSLFATILLSAGECNSSKKKSRYKGRLEVAGICMNYTISVIAGNLPADQVVSKWTDEVTKKEYINVFRLGNPCQFPSRIRQGDEFYFTIDSADQKECIVCMAYYPTPEKALNIKIIE